MSIIKFFSRLKERPDHLKRFPEYSNLRPPLGIMPMDIWIEQRIDDLNNAIARYENAGLLPNKEWKDEIIYLSIHYMQCQH